MTKSRIAPFLASLALLGTLFVVLPGLGADEKKDEGGKDSLYRPLGLFTEVLSLVRGNYVEKVEVKPLLAGAFSGMTEAMDPFSEYVPPEKMAAFEAARAAREKADYVDSGLVLARRSGYPVVVTAVPGSPAALAGVETDDLVEKVGGVSARSLGLWEVEAALSGKPGGRANVLVVRESKPRRRTLRDRPGVVDAVAPVGGERLGGARREGSGFRRRHGRRPRRDSRPARPVQGHRHRPSRQRVRVVGRSRAVRGALRPSGPHRRAEGAEDRRRRAGARKPGSGFTRAVSSSSSTAARAVRPSSSPRRSARTRRRSWESTSRRRSSERKRRGTRCSRIRPPPAPVPSLDRKKLRVRVVGEPTFGMGLTQEVVRLASGGALKITVGKVRTAAGRSLSPRGLEPDDRVFHVQPEEGAEGKPPDPFLERALKVVAELPASPAAAS